MLLIDRTVKKDQSRIYDKWNSLPWVIRQGLGIVFYIWLDLNNSNTAYKKGGGPLELMELQKWLVPTDTCWFIEPYLKNTENLFVLFPHFCRTFPDLCFREMWKWRIKIKVWNNYFNFYIIFYKIYISRMHDNFTLHQNWYDSLKMKTKGKCFSIVCFSCGSRLFVHALHIVASVRNLYHYICCGHFLCLN